MAQKNTKKLVKTDEKITLNKLTSKQQKNVDNSLVWTKRIRKFAKWVGIPLLLYFFFFCIYSWPWISNFNTSFMTDAGDGLQNVWNIWWVNKSVTELQQLPWHTSFLHAPHGVTLLGQTLNPFNGFVAIGLLTFLSLTQAFNVMIIFSFVVAGLTAFWLCYYFSRSYVPSLIGGFIYTFSSYHFAHAIGHMQLVSLQWIPLFILLWWMLLKRPRYLTAVGAAIALLLVLMCDYYYFLYSVITAGIIVLYFWRTNQLPPLKSRKTILPFGVFGAVSLLLVAPLPLALLRLNSQEVLSGSHPTRELSTNVIAPFLNGGFWRFAWLTDWYWKRVPAGLSESSIYLGISVIGMSLVGLFKRNKIKKDINFWLILAFVFGVFSYGPRLMIGSNSIEMIPLPYAFLEKIFPPLKLSGVPVRMMVMVTLSVAVISALVLAKINLSQTKGKVILGVIFAVLFIDMFPAKLPITPDEQPNYVKALRELPAGIVYDNGTETSPEALYSQTYHEKPMVLGYISRTPQSVENKDWLIVATFLQNRYSEACSKYKVRYYTTSADKPILQTGFRVVYKDSEVIIYDLKNSPNC